MKKRIISLLLTVAMLLSVIPVLANADAAVTEPSFKSVSLTLDGILRLNVKVNPGTVTDMSGYKVKFTVGEDAPVECTEATQQNGLYVYTAKIPAHKLQKAVKVELLNAESEVLGQSTWTLDAYLDSIVAWDAGLNKLADALELYATNAAAYAANTESTAPATAVEQATLVDYKSETELPNTDLAPSAKLLLNDACTIRVQVKASNWVEGYGLKINGEAKELAYNEVNDLYYYEIKDIRAQGWGTKYAVEFVDGEGETVYKCNYAAMSYVYTVLGTPENYEKEINLLKAMYLYFAEADNYIKAERFEYGLNYNANYEGATETKADSENVSGITAGSKDITVDANAFNRPGYKFTGWNTKADGTGTAYKAGDVMTMGGQATLLNEDFNAISDAWKSYEAGTETNLDNWYVDNGSVKHNNNNGISILMLDTVVNATNYEVTADIVLPAGNTNTSIGLVFADNYFFRIWNSSGYFYLYAGTDANNTNSNLTGYNKVQAGIGLSSKQNITVKLKVEGNQFSILVNDQNWTETMVPAVTNKADLTGKIGLYLRTSSAETSAAFKNIKVTAPSEKTATLYAQWEDDAFFVENFDNKVVSDSWTQYDTSAVVTTDVWSAADGSLKYTGSSTGNSMVIFDTAVNADKYELTTNIVMPSAGSIGLVFAASENEKDLHYFRIFNSSGTFKMYAGHMTNGMAESMNTKYATGTAMPAALATTLVSKQAATLKVAVDGQNFTISVNDVVWTSGTTTNANLHGKFGLLLRNGSAAASHSFDDVKVTVSGMLMYKDFNNKVVSDSWTTYETSALVDTNNWSAADGNLQYKGADTGNSALIFDDVIEADNYEFSTTIVMPSAGSIGLVFAASEDGKDMHYFRIFVSGNEYRLYAGRFTNGMVESNMDVRYTKALSSNGYIGRTSEMTDVAKGKTVTLKVVVEGQNFSLYANNKLWLSGTTNGENLHGQVGLFMRSGSAAAGHSFDNVVVVEKTPVAG